MNDFDFLIGSWHVANHRLTKRLANSNDWEDFPGTHTAIGFFGGGGSFDEMHCPTKGWTGASLRTYHPATQEWSIYWISNLDGILQPPVVGRFVNGVGEFFGDDEFEGIPIRVRFRWSDITPTSARWQQAFSTDGGQTWEVNWTMDFTRT